MKLTVKNITLLTALTVVAAGCAASANQQLKDERMGERMPRAERMFERIDTDKDGQITQADMQAFAAARFARMDANSDGTVTPDERKASRMAHRESRKADRFARMDANGDGSVSMDEMKAARGARAERRFGKLDANADGVLSQAEMMAGKGRHGGKGHHGKHHAKHGGKHGKGKGEGEGRWGKRGPVTLEDMQARAAKRFERMDANKDGIVTLEELKAMPRRRG